MTHWDARIQELETLAAEVAQEYEDQESARTRARDAFRELVRTLCDVGHQHLGRQAPVIAETVAAEHPGRPRVQWRRKDRAHGDPVWTAQMGNLRLDVRVPHAEWFWEWSIDSDDEGEMARGTLFVDGDDEEWNYQDVEVAQCRCERVARTLVREDS